MKKSKGTQKTGQRQGQGQRQGNTEDRAKAKARAKAREHRRQGKGKGKGKGKGTQKTGQRQGNVAARDTKIGSIMVKMNYTKVEEALTEGMRKMEVNKLLKATEKNTDSSAPKEVSAAQRQRLTTLHHELKSLEKQGTDPYRDLKIDKAELKKFLKDPLILTSEDWNKIKLIKDAVAKYKEKMFAPQMPSTEENDDKAALQTERKKQGTRRFNVKDTWIPLR